MTTLPADELVERLEKRAETYNTGVAVPPNSFGTLGYYSSHDADLDRKAAAELSSLRAKLAEATEVLEGAEAFIEQNYDPAYDCDLLKEVRCARRLIEGNGNG